MLDHESMDQLYVNITNLAKIRIARNIIADTLPDKMVLEKERVIILEILDDWENRVNAILQ